MRNLETGTIELVSTGPRGNQDNYGVRIGGATPGGTHVYFLTAEPLVDEDVEASCPFHDGLGEVGCVDLYERDLTTETTRLISTGPKKTGNDGSGVPKGTTDDASFAGVTPSGTHVFFTTKEQLVDADTDLSRDVYERFGGTTTLLSASSTGGNGANDSSFVGSSPDGRSVFIGTFDPLAPTDTDGQFDIYKRFHDGAFELMTTGPIGGNGPYHATRGRINADASRLFFETSERLVADDPDQTPDVYERFNGTTTLISKGPTGESARDASTAGQGAVADDGRRLFFTALGRLVPDDTDNARDIYVSIANEPPRCDAVKPDQAVLWPPNRKFRTITLAGATDPDGDPFALEITGVTQDEPVGGAPDARPSVGDDQVRLRSERDPAGDGRVYHVAFKVSDDHGGSCHGDVTVSVPRHRGRPAVDSGPPTFDSFAR